MNRNLEDPSEPSRMNQNVSRSIAQKNSTPSCMEKSNKRMPCSSGSAKCKKPNGSSTKQATEKLNNNHGDTNGEKVSVEVIEWPKIYIALSRKEKEDDFLAMKGTKIPQRPKKRAKNIDKTLQVYILSLEKTLNLLHQISIICFFFIYKVKHVII